MAFIIGLTGGIGSGKSTVMSIFSELGIQTIDADQIVRELLDTDTQLSEQIKEHFGTNYFDNQGQLDRRSLREQIFSNSDDRQFLESLIHPRVRDTLIETRKNCKTPYGVFVIPLLIESRMTDIVDRVAVVDVPVEEQIVRIMKRDGIDESMAKKAINSQIARSERLAHADDVIDNTVSLVELKNNIGKLHSKYLELAKHH